MATISELASKAVAANRFLAIWPYRKDTDGNIHYNVVDITRSSYRAFRHVFILDVRSAATLLAARNLLSDAAKARFDAIPLTPLMDYARKVAPPRSSGRSCPPIVANG